MDLLDEKKRKENEKKFGTWKELSDGGRRYSYEIRGRYNWMARYVKEVDSMEKTLKFYQEIYNSNGILIEIHQKYPEDTGHRKIRDESYDNHS